MAQEIRNQGPFVVASVRGRCRCSGWVIRVTEDEELVVPLLCVGEIICRLGLKEDVTRDREKAIAVCGALNKMVRTGEIVLAEYGSWVTKRFAGIAGTKEQHVAA